MPTPYGEEELRIPPGTQPETVVRLRGRGPPGPGPGQQGRSASCGCTSGRPERLTDEQERLFRELAKLEGEPPKRSPGFWSKLKEALGA